MQLFGIDPQILSQILFQFLWFAVIIFLSMQSQKIQLSLWMGQIRKALIKLKGYSKHAKDITLQLVKDFGKPSFDPKNRIGGMNHILVPGRADLRISMIQPVMELTRWSCLSMKSCS